MKLPAVSEIARALRRHPTRAVAAALAAVVLLVLVIGRGEDSAGGPVAAPAPAPTQLLGALRAAVPLQPDTPGLSEGAGPRYAIAQVVPAAQVDLHESPGGTAIARVSDRTEFGSARTFWVEEVRGDWFGVPAPELADGKLGWIHDDPNVVQVLETRFSIVADVSARRLELRYGKRVLDRFPVTVGSPGSPTPLGEYSVTDGLAGRGVGPYYGCCILALSGHQPHLPPNWLGGDRIAIHGTPDLVGGNNSAGCLRASDRDMVSLFARVPLGAPVFIRA